jgi:uncharacterized OB-fold protein
VTCTSCQSDELRFEEVSGHGTIYSYAIFVQSFMPSYEAPYTIALVDLDDCPGVRMMTNIVQTDPENLQIGMPVQVVFEARGDWVIPQFTPVGLGS